MANKKKVRNNIRSKLENRKRQQTERSNETNPFELKRNKIKHEVLGRKIAKNEIGRPLLNRSRAYQKRSQTLLEEYKNVHKKGKGLRDMREVNAEARITSKYKEVQKDVNFGKSEQIQLTHKGKPLEDFIEDRLSSDDDEDIDLFNREDFIETTHFGGGSEGAARSSSDVLKEIMQEKHDKKVAKEESKQLIDKLDSQWGELKSLLKHKGAHGTGPDTTRDDYDNLLSQLLFEGKKPVSEPVNNVPKVVAEKEPTAAQNPDTVLRSKIKTIDVTNDIEIVVKLLKEVLPLLPNVTSKSFDYLKDRLQKLTLSSLKFTPKEMSILVICAYFKQFQLVTDLLILKTLSKLKYANYHEIAVATFLINFLLRTISDKTLCPELFIHVHNLIRLCTPAEKAKLTLSTRLDYEADCILSVSQYCNDDTLEQSAKFLVTPLTLFGRLFADEIFDKRLLAFNLTTQIVQLSLTLFQKYSQMPIIGKLMKPIGADLKLLANCAIPKELATLISQFGEKFTQKPASIIVNKTLPKPFILPMLEPKFDEFGGKRSKDDDDDSRVLKRKLKREMRGAKRELRKDANFLRDTHLKELQKKDRARQMKVKEILRDLSVQQGLYKKK